MKDEISNNDTSVGQRKNLGPWQESNPWPPEHRAGALSAELRELMESEAILLSSYVTCVLNTARISNVDVIMNCDKWKWWWIFSSVNFFFVIMNCDKWKWHFFVPRSCHCWLFHLSHLIIVYIYIYIYTIIKRWRLHGQLLTFHAQGDHQTVPLMAVERKFKLHSWRAVWAMLLLIGCIKLVFVPALGD